VDTRDQSYILHHAPSGAPRPRKRRDWIWLFLLVPVILVIGAIWGYWYLANRFAQYGPVARTLPAELAAARREGLPLTPADLRPNPPVPESQNAAPLYREITRLIGKDKADGNAFSDYLKGQRDSAATATVRQLLTKWAEPLRLAELAAQRPRCDFHRPWEQGPDVMLPEFAAMRGVVRALAVRAVIENAGGRPLDALSTVETISRISQHAGEDPIVIGMLVKIALQAFADRPFREVLFAHIDDPSVLRKARTVLASFDPPPNIEHAFRGEVVMCRVCTDIIRKQPNQVEQFFGQRKHPTEIRRDMTDAWEARMLSYWRSVFTALRETRANPVERYRRTKALGDEIERHDGDPSYELAAILMPVFAQAQLKVLGIEARHRLQEGCIALADFHRTHGRFPSSAEAVGLVPNDPFTAKPLIYRPTGSGFLIYSVGENFKDDGGIDKPAKKGDPAPDIVAQFLPRS